jgi:hypothetical protein
MPLQIVAKEMKSHTITESVILPACCKIVNIMFGEEYEKEILKISMSDNTVSRCIQDMSQQVESQASINGADFFAIHLGESNDITGEGQPLEFSFYFANHSQKQQRAKTS